MNPKENQKRIYETALVKAFNSFGITALSSYGITTSKYENDKEIFDTIQSTNTSSTNLLLIVRLVEIEKRTRHIPSATYLSPIEFHHMRDHSYQHPSHYFIIQPGYNTTDILVRLESNLYSLRDKQLLWSGITESLNPRSLTKNATTLAKLIYNRTIENRLINHP